VTEADPLPPGDAQDQKSGRGASVISAREGREYLPVVRQISLASG